MPLLKRLKLWPGNAAGLRFAALALMIAAMLVFPPEVSAGKIYQWKDAGGVVHFTDNPGEVPAKKRDTSQREVTPLSGTRASSSGQGVQSGREIWEAKCQACHVYNSDYKDNELTGIFSHIVNPDTKFPFAYDAVFDTLKNAVSGFGEGMPAVDISEEELKTLTQFLIESLKP